MSKRGFLISSSSVYGQIPGIGLGGPLETDDDDEEDEEDDEEDDELLLLLLLLLEALTYLCKYFLR